MTEEGQFGTKQRILHGVKLWWVCRKINGRYVPYADVHAPTGYGFKSRANAERKAAELEAQQQEAQP